MQKIFAKCLYFTKKTELSQTDTDFNQLKTHVRSGTYRQLQTTPGNFCMVSLVNNLIPSTLPLPEVSLLVIL